MGRTWFKVRFCMMMVQGSVFSGSTQHSMSWFATCSLPRKRPPFQDPNTYLHNLDVILTNIDSFVEIQEVLFFQVRPNQYI